jgi:hypothetical protein
MTNQWTISITGKVARSLDMPTGDPAWLLKPAEDYVVKTLPEAFTNFEVLLPLFERPIPGTVFDATVFYSKRKKLTEEQEQLLFDFNERAFGMAANVGGLIIYYQGDLLTGTVQNNQEVPLRFTPNCMSFCIWESLKHAKVGAQIPEHREAAARVSHWFDGFAIEKYEITIRKRKKNGELYHDIVFRRVPKVSPSKVLA